MVLMNNMIGMKRSREAAELSNITAMANCLMLLSGAGEFQVLNNITSSATTNISNPHNHHHHHHHDLSPSRVFECKTCNRQFPSFQALGGHRASHKKPKLGGDLSLQSHLQASPPKPKTHECSICGQEFAVGQALGGHMRRHRAAMNEESHHHQQQHQSPASSTVSSPAAAVVEDKRAWGLDLNLTPFENDGLEFGLGKMVAPPPAVDCV